MKRLLYISIFTVLCFPLSLSGQEAGSFVLGNQYPVYSQYLLNGLAINPAYAGTRDALSVSASVRKRMLGFEGESSMSSFALHLPLKKERVALGMSADHFSYGVSTHTRLYGYYAFHINTSGGKWSLGIQGGVDMISSNYSEVTTGVSDPAFEVGKESYVLPNVGAGIYYVTPKIFAGIAVPALLTYTSDTLSSGFNSGVDYNYYDILFSAGGLLSFSDDFKFKPSLMARYNMSNILRLDLNGNFILYNFLWLGGSWRIGEDAVVGLVELQVTQQLRFGYSYDYNLGELSNFTGGTHEIGLRFDLGKKVTASNPRYF